LVGIDGRGSADARVHVCGSKFELSAQNVRRHRRLRMPWAGFRRPALPEGAVTAQEHPRVQLRRAIERGNVLVAEVTPRTLVKVLVLLKLGRSPSDLTTRC
jgi:hypothetical protein